MKRRVVVCWGLVSAAIAVWAWRPALAAASGPAYAIERHEDEPPAAGDRGPVAEDEEVLSPQAWPLVASEAPAALAVAVGALRRQPLLPDLQTLPPSDLHLIFNPTTDRRLIRFSNAIWNAGPAPLELVGRPDGAAIRVWQRYFTRDGTLVEREVGVFCFHPGQTTGTWMNSPAMNCGRSRPKER